MLHHMRFFQDLSNACSPDEVRSGFVPQHAASFRVPRSFSFGRVQERHAKDAYCLLASCILFSRTSGAPAVKEVVSEFFEIFPTPTSVVDADLEILRAVLLPLGLNRCGLGIQSTACAPSRCS